MKIEMSINFAIFCAMGNVFFWVITRRVVVIPYRCFGTTYHSYLQKPPEDGNDRLFRNAGKELDSSWNVLAHGDAREGKWRGNWRMEWVASTLHSTSEHGVYSITTADAHTSAASSRLNWRPRRFKWTRPFRRKTKPGFCACAAITFQLASTITRCVITQKSAAVVYFAAAAWSHALWTKFVSLIVSPNISKKRFVFNFKT